MINLLAQNEFTWPHWLETQSPLWVIYAMVIVGLIWAGRSIAKYGPAIIEKHIYFVEVATDSLAKSADAIKSVQTEITVNRGIVVGNREHMADAAKPFCRALLAMTPESAKQEVREHLAEVQQILNRD